MILLSSLLILNATTLVLQRRGRWLPRCIATLFSPNLICLEPRIVDRTLSVTQERVRWQQHCSTTRLSSLLNSDLTSFVIHEQVIWRQHCNTSLLSLLLIYHPTPSVI